MSGAALLAYLFYFVAATASPLQRRWLATTRAAESSGQIHFAFLVTAVTVVLSLLLPFFEPFVLAGDHALLLSLATICGISGAGYFVASYVAQRHVEAGVTTLVSNIYTPITIVLASVFLQEALTLTQVYGTILLLLGMLLVAKKHRTGRFTFDKYFLLMLLSGASLGVCLTAERALQIHTGFTAGTMLSWWAQCLFLGVAAVATGSRTQYGAKDVVATGTLRFLQSLSWVILIFVVANLSVVSAVTTFKVVVMFVAAAILLNEREDLGRKIFGSVVALAGLLLMK